MATGESVSPYTVQIMGVGAGQGTVTSSTGSTTITARSNSLISGNTITISNPSTTITATPASGYVFDCWTNGTHPTSGAVILSDGAYSSHLYLFARFKEGVEDERHYVVQKQYDGEKWVEYVPKEVKGENKGATLAWNTTTTIANIGGTDITVKLPSNPDTNTDTKTSSANSTSKLFLVGATSQSSSGQTTYSNSSVYETNGSLYATTIYEDSTSLANKYLGKTAKASSATSADSATKATQDASGNNIANTYATKTELTNGLAGKSDTGHTHEYLPLSGGILTGALAVPRLDCGHVELTPEGTVTCAEVIENGKSLLNGETNHLGNAPFILDHNGANEVTIVEGDILLQEGENCLQIIEEGGIFLDGSVYINGNEPIVEGDSRLSNARTPTAHNQASNTINAMTGYSKPSSTSAITTSDTLNTAVGKLEKALDDIKALLDGDY